ncbi:uncharacterized protein LOC117651873 [Thrips palmi]|uniref:Uncharacterized protein LOC117651873 n=1 Tax=Thrips palmi TaxID=161013 RepID=A0A6P9A357_THRPL|nr:uncharacterized protein LOC117651873 [Thrips palmi]
MAAMQLFVTVALIQAAASRTLLVPSRLVAEVPVLQACSGVRGNACVFEAPIARSIHGRGNYTFSGAFNITRSAQHIAEILLDFTRCRDVVSSNTCEHFHTWRLHRNACRTWMDPEAPWASLVKAFSSSYQCPTKEGTYRMKDATLDTKGLSLLNLPLEGAVWQTTITFVEPTGSTHYCIEGTTVFHRVRA